MDTELLYSKFSQALREHRYLDAKATIYEAHRGGIPAGHILVKIVNRALEQLQKSVLSETAAVSSVDFGQKSQEFFKMLMAGERAGVRKLAETLVQKGVAPSEILLDVITPAMDQIGELQSRQEISLAQIFMASRITEEVLGYLLPMLPARPEGKGKILIGNAFGDYHSLGRKIVATFLRFYGFEVVDLGESVPNEKFVEQAIQTGAEVIFVSALLLHTANQIPKLSELLKARDLGHVKLVAGGAPFNFDKKLAQRLGCDCSAENAMAAVRVARKFLGA